LVLIFCPFLLFTPSQSLDNQLVAQLSITLLEATATDLEGTIPILEINITSLEKNYNWIGF
jgi:hypothetical protein